MYQAYKKLCEKTDVFYEKVLKDVVAGFDVSVFNYMLAIYSDFNDNDAFDVRGLTYVHEKKDDQIIHHKHLALPKFFNVNETEVTLESNLKNKELLYVYEKLDGSMVQPIMFPNGEIKWKTKNSFDNKQARMAAAISDNVEPHIIEGLSLGIEYIFELISPLNQIVVDYPTTELILLGARNPDGSFNKERFDSYEGPKAKACEYSFDELLSLKKTLTDFEGWVLWFNDGTICKLKTDWYINLHGTISEINVSVIALLALKDELDDIKIFLSGEKLSMVEEIEKTVSNKYNSYVKETMDWTAILQKYLQGSPDNGRKNFVLDNKDKMKEDIFSLVMRSQSPCIDKVMKNVKELMLKRLFKKERAEEFLGYTEKF